MRKYWFRNSIRDLLSKSYWHPCIEHNFFFFPVTLVGLPLPFPLPRLNASLSSFLVSPSRIDWFHGCNKDIFSLVFLTWRPAPILRPQSCLDDLAVVLENPRTGIVLQSHTPGKTDAKAHNFRPQMFAALKFFVDLSFAPKVENNLIEPASLRFIRRCRPQQSLVTCWTFLDQIVGMNSATQSLFCFFFTWFFCYWHFPL
jgi:hypothetical protein